MERITGEAKPTRTNKKRRETRRCINSRNNERGWDKKTQKRRIPKKSKTMGILNKKAVANSTPINGYKYGDFCLVGYLSARYKMKTAAKAGTIMKFSPFAIFPSKNGKVDRIAKIEVEAKTALCC